MPLAIIALLSMILAAAPASAADPDAAFLARIQAMREAARQAGPQLWPGWDPLATPLAIYKGSEMTVLVGHPSPPAGFRRFPAPGIAVPVFVSDSTAGFAHANTAQNFGGVLTSFFSYGEFMDAPAPDGVAIAVHEIFHALEKRIAPDKFGDMRMLVWGGYPEFSAPNRALLSLEAGALLSGWNTPNDADARRAAAEFLTLRAERRKELSAEQTRYESGEEANEGLARYIELRMLQLLVGQASTPAAAGADAAAAKRIDRLKTINNLARDRERFYVLGMAQAALLDRVRPGWKNEYQSSPAMLDELLARSVERLPAAESAALLEKLAYKQLLEEQQKAAGRRTEEGSQRLARLFSRGGERVVFEIGALKNHMTLRGFNPNGTVALTPALTAHIFLMLDLGAAPMATMRLDFTNVPAIYDAAQDALWTLLPSDSIKKAVEEFTKAPPAGAGKLIMTADGFKAELTGVEIEQRPHELRVRAPKDLKKAPQYKPPEFIRP